MLIIGNADYMNSECQSCQNKYKHFNSIDDIYESIAKIREKMEQLGFITMSFINLNTREYKRSLKLFKRLCEPANKVFVLVYMTGHGFNNFGKDNLVSIDSQRHYHLNGHRNFLKESTSLSLNYLMECFVSPPDHDKFHVGVFCDFNRTSV